MDRRQRSLAPSLLLSLALALASILGAPAAPARAGASSADGWCLKAYNYADPGQGYLFASTEATTDPYGQQCDWVHVSILNHATVLDGPSGTEGTSCAGTILALSGAHRYESVSVTLGSGEWSTPCSHHEAGYQPPVTDSRLGLYFSY